MLNSRKAKYSHEDVFIQRHEWLLSWALQMTDRDQERAEDLIQDAFIHFILARPDLDSIQSLEGYLYVMLKNMHLSQVRRVARIQSRTLSIVDYDSVAIGLRAADPHTNLQARDQLRSVCHYACVRKEKSKAGSVLILRFFHGYYPSEISRILKSPRRAVDDWLRMARREAKLYIEVPGRLAFQNEESGSEIIISGQTDDLLSELRHTIFRSRHNDCLSSEQLQELYSSSQPMAVDCAALAHLVSCPDCLDKVNKLLGLPSLSDRYPTDMIGRNGPDTPTKSGSGNSKRSADSATPEPKSFRLQVKDVFEHRPTELRISVNGFILGSQSLGSELSEQTLNVSIPEKIGFIEVFSEQELRLLFMSVEPPPDGPVEQPACVEFSEGRTLELTLNFKTLWPSVQSVYFDPTFNSLHSSEPPALEDGAVVVSSDDQQQKTWKEAPSIHLLPPVDKWPFGLRTWFNPRMVAAIFGIVLLFILFLMPKRGPSASAAELLRRASSSEEASAAKPDLVIHRTLNFEERKPSNGTLGVRRRIELWANAAKGIKARRVYDEKNQIIAAEWTQGNEMRLIYHREAARRFERSPKQSAEDLLASSDIWQLELSAKEFSAIAGSLHEASVSERADTYIIHYQGQATAVASRLRSATLTLRKADLHPLEQRLLIGQDGQELEYRFAEQGFERVSDSKVIPAVFEIDPELLNRAAKPSGGIDLGRFESPTSATPESGALGPAAFAELRVEALYQLHQIGSCVRERANLMQSADGGLRISAIVETEKRKEEMREALNSLSKVRAVKVEINTVAEVGRRQQALPPVPLIVRRVEITKDQVPAYAELRRYFEKTERDVPASEKQSTSGQVDEAIRRFANRMLGLSRQALLQAWALKHHREEIANSDFGSLSLQTQARWRTMLSEHALALQKEIGSMRVELQPIFFPEAPANGANDEDESRIDNAADIAQAIESLFKLAAANEKAVRSAFAVSTESPATLAMKTERFWYSLHSMQGLARRIQKGK